MMKYHNHYIIKVRSDDYEDNDIKWYYQIYDSNRNYITDAVSRGSAKSFIDTGYDYNYL